MKLLKLEVEMSATTELKRANDKFDSKFHSTHEGYSIIKEEVEEAQEELTGINVCLDELWQDARSNNISYTVMDAINIKKYAINLSAESIQIAAMCQKFIDSFEK